MKLPTITIATSVRYGNYKEYLDNAFNFIDVIKHSLNEIKQFVKLPRNFTIHFRPIRNAYGRAYYYTPYEYSNTKQYCVEIDVRQDIDVFKNTLIHELVHIEQFYQKRLVNAGPTHFKWKGSKMLIDESTFETYCDSPWEIEANTRAEFIYYAIFI